MWKIVFFPDETQIGPRKVGASLAWTATFYRLKLISVPHSFQIDLPKRCERRAESSCPCGKDAVEHINS